MGPHPEWQCNRVAHPDLAGAPDRLKSAPGGSLLRNASGISADSAAEDGAAHTGAPYALDVGLESEPAAAPPMANGGAAASGGGDEAAAGLDPSSRREAMSAAAAAGPGRGAQGEGATLMDLEDDRGPRPQQDREDLRCGLWGLLCLPSNSLCMLYACCWYASWHAFTHV